MPIRICTAGEETVRQGGLERDQVRHVGDAARHQAGLTLGRRKDHLVGEVGAEHLGLELKEAVEQPEDPEADLDRTGR